jgi:hypothetical protein
LNRAVHRQIAQNFSKLHTFTTVNPTYGSAAAKATDESSAASLPVVHIMSFWTKFFSSRVEHRGFGLFSGRFRLLYKIGRT